MRNLGSVDCVEADQDAVHYAFHRLLHVHFRKDAYLVESDMTSVPEPTDSGREQVEIEGRDTEVWRPDWSNPSSSRRAACFEAM